MSAHRAIGWPPTSSRPDHDHQVQLSEGTYIELVRSVFVTLLPATIMTLSFISVGSIIILGTPDRPLLYLFVLAVAAALVRITVLLLFRRTAVREGLTAKMAGKLERRFALAYLGFACMFGAFTARAFALVPAEDQMLIVGLLFGYGAGVAAGISLRPWISIPSALIAITPTIVVCLFMVGPKFWVLGALTAVFLAGGIDSMLKRYQATSKQLAMNRLVSTLARHDSLTGLPNRLLLDERFSDLRSSSNDKLVALHRLDLDQFRAINEIYGHSIGDALLKAVVTTLGDILGPGDFAVRLGGVEFAVVQTGLVQARQADLFARRAVAAIAKSYSISGHDIEIRVNIGYAHDTQHHAELDHMLACANQALIRGKKEATDVACYNKSRWRARIDKAA